MSHDKFFGHPSMIRLLRVQKQIINRVHLNETNTAHKSWKRNAGGHVIHERTCRTGDMERVVWAVGGKELNISLNVV
jgi:hypothetical protein